MPDRLASKQRLNASNRSPNIREALSARTKDPLWFLARQWQTGEFEGENGGHLVAVDVKSRVFPVKSVTLGKEILPLDPHDPLEAIVEAEDSSRDAPAWRSEALEYEFDLTTRKHTLKARDYSGFQLDWYQFDLSVENSAADAEIEHQSLVPSQLSFAGAPEPQWWRMEHSAAFFDSPTDSSPNALSVLLPEFFYTDINNWYLIPFTAKAGNTYEIDEITVTDSFGVMTEIKPVRDKDWQVFTLAMSGKPNKLTPPHVFFSPNIAIDILHNDPIEDVRFLRDEQTNLVWAWEHFFTDADGVRVRNGDKKGAARVPAPADAPPGMPSFKLMSEVPTHWIPYVPRYVQQNDVVSGQIYLRRARTQQDIDPANPQHNSKLVSESIRLNEEEVPRTGLRVRRIGRYARGSDGQPHFWIARHKDAGQGTARPGLKFDFIEKGSGTGGPDV
ncbi:MAG: hypothetical protein AAFX02_09985 [Pseudomonadota bacterium]